MATSNKLAGLSRVSLAALAIAAVPAALLTQAYAAQPNVDNTATALTKPFVNSDKDTTPYDKRDFSGLWARNPSDQFGQAPCPECRDPGPSYGYFGDVPPMTPEGEKRFLGNRPTKGLNPASKEAEARKNLHVAYRRSFASNDANDPEERCDPLGLIRLVTFSGGNPPMQIIQNNEIIVQRFEWFWDNREIWLDGRALPKVEDYLPRFNGYSVGKWEGDTLVVTTVGLDDRQWVDAFGFPISGEAVLEERYSRPSHNRLRLDMTITDPKTYTKPWHSYTKAWGLIPKKAMSIAGWSGLVEDRCVPSDNNYFRSLEPKGLESTKK